jgi:hypothetical protein
MKSITEIIDSLKHLWLKPKKGIHNNDETFFELQCEFAEEKAEIPIDYPLEFPKGILDFWNNARDAELFIDKKYGQWGLKMYSPQDAISLTRKEIETRPDEYKDTDLIIGSFIGDSDMLVISCDPKNFGQIFVSTPLDSREDWWLVSDSFKEFLNQYSEKDGEKYWEN